MSIVAAVCGLILLRLSHGADHFGFVSFANPNGTTFVDVVKSYNDSPIHWYASSPSMARIVIAHSRPVSVHFHCFVRRLDPKSYPLRFINFCFRQRTGEKEPQCETLPSKEGIKKKELVVKWLNRSVTASLTFSSESGGTASLTNIPPTQSLDSLLFFCKVGNRRGFLTSNAVEIFDYRSRLPTEPWRPPLPTGSLPLTGQRRFRCLSSPLAADPSVRLDFRWHACPDASCRSGTSILDVAGPLQWPVQVLAGGDLYWPFVPAAAAKRLQGKTLMCSVGGRVLASYRAPLAFTGGTAAAAVKLVEPKLGQEVALFDSAETEVTLPVLVDGADEKTTWTWTREVDGKREKIPSSRTKGKSCWEERKLIRCRGPFSNEEGTFRIEVKAPTSRTGAVGSYRIRSVSYPRLSAQMETSLLVADGLDARVTCDFQDQKKITSEVTVLGFPVIFKSQEAIKKEMDDINFFMLRVMMPLDISMSTAQPKEGEELTYTAKKLVYRDPKKNLSSSHYIECVGHRLPSSVRRQVKITVVPRPLMGNTPSSTNLVNVNSDATRVLHCELLNAKDIESSGAVASVSWRLGNKTVTALSPEMQQIFNVSRGGSRLVVKPFRTQEQVDAVNEAREVVCVVELRYPAGSSRLAGTAFYSSEREDHRAEMSTKVLVVFNRPPLSGGAIAGIVVCCLVLAIIIIAVIVTVVVCYRRRRVAEPRRTGNRFNGEQLGMEQLRTNSTPRRSNRSKTQSTPADIFLH